MASFFREGERLSFHGFKGKIIKITETYRKNVVVIKVDEFPARNPFPGRKIEFMSIID